MDKATIVNGQWVKVPATLERQDGKWIETIDGKPVTRKESK